MSHLTNILQHIVIPKTSEELSQAQRLFHGRGHAYEGLHHVSIDWLPPVILITLFAPEPTSAINDLAKQLQELIPDAKSIQLQQRYELLGPIELISGEEITELVTEENHQKYQIQLGKSRNTGLFLDMQNGRRWVQNNSRNKRVLNLFSYTCGFSVTAITGNAQAVVNIDMSSSALSVGRKNHYLNNHDLSKVKFEKLNIFRSFGRLKKRGPFDLLICDPPTLQKGSVDIVKDYPKIMRRLDEFMAPNATLMLCLNAPELDRSLLFDNMKEFAPNYTFIEEIKPPEVYKEAEGKGLKTLIFKEL